MAGRPWALAELTRRVIGRGHWGGICRKRTSTIKRSYFYGTEVVFVYLYWSWENDLVFVSHEAPFTATSSQRSQVAENCTEQGAKNHCIPASMRWTISFSLISWVPVQLRNTYLPKLRNEYFLPSHKWRSGVTKNQVRWKDHWNVLTIQWSWPVWGSLDFFNLNLFLDMIIIKDRHNLLCFRNIHDRHYCCALARHMYEVHFNQVSNLHFLGKWVEIPFYLSNSSLFLKSSL